MSVCFSLYISNVSNFEKLFLPVSDDYDMLVILSNSTVANRRKDCIQILSDEEGRIFIYS